jgi:hypothetical protein
MRDGHVFMQKAKLAHAARVKKATELCGGEKEGCKSKYPIFAHKIQGVLQTPPQPYLPKLRSIIRWGAKAAKPIEEIEHSLWMDKSNPSPSPLHADFRAMCKENGFEPTSYQSRVQNAILPRRFSENLNFWKQFRAVLLLVSAATAVAINPDLLQRATMVGRSGGGGGGRRRKSARRNNTRTTVTRCHARTRNRSRKDTVTLRGGTGKRRATSRKQRGGYSII